MFRYMNYAYAVYKEKSFTKAAEKLYISQPSLSITIKKLEDGLGCPVFERSGKEIRLTPVGEKYIAAAEEIMKIKSGFENELDDILSLKKGKITIGSTIFISSYLLPDILKRFSKKYPHIELEVVVDSSTALWGSLERGKLDIIIDNSVVQPDGYAFVPVLKEKILLGVPCGFKINQKHSKKQISEAKIKNGDYQNIRKIPMTEFKNENFILLKPGNKMRMIANKVFDEDGISPKVLMEFDQLITAVSYAESGFGICFLTDTILKYAKACRGLCYYVPDTEFKERTLYVIYKKSKYLSRGAKAFIDEFEI